MHRAQHQAEEQQPAHHGEDSSKAHHAEADVFARGADVLLAGAEVNGALTLTTVASHPVIEPLLMIQSFYRMASSLAVARGFNPDQPPHLNKVTETI